MISWSKLLRKGSAMGKDELIKGFYSLFSNYENNQLNKHNKKGSEIKSNLGSIITDVNKQKQECLDKMNTRLGVVNYAPDTPCTDMNEYYHLIDYIPKKFSWGLMSEGEKYTETSNGIVEQMTKVPTPEERSEMREYNNHAHKYIELCVMKIKLESLRRNIQENKSYPLSIDQLSILGF